MTYRTLMTDYYQEFACIGGSCPDNCCIGWQVELDKETFQSYQRIEDRELRKKGKRYVYRNREETDPSMDYGLVELLPNRRCPFLNPDNLCSIQFQMGESHLSNVCAGYPRMINRVEGVLEYSLTLSCPEAALLLLDREEPLSWHKGEGELERRQILNVDYRASDYKEQYLAENLVLLREKTLSILQNREHSLTRRIQLLGDFFEGLAPSQGPSQRNDRGKEWTFTERCQFWEEIHQKFHTPDYIDSPRYLVMMESSDPLPESLEFPERLEVVLENYLVNYVFQSLFPAGESQDPKDAFLKLGIRYAMVKYGAMKQSSSDNPLDRKVLVALIQCFSKATEHHFTYFDDILVHVKRQVGDTRQIRTLIEL